MTAPTATSPAIAAQAVRATHLLYTVQEMV
jgi:hypothetical protein